MTDITSNYTLPTGIKVFHGDRTSPILKIFYIDSDMNNPDLVIHPYIGVNKTLNNFIASVETYTGVNVGFWGGSSSYSTVAYPYEVNAKIVLQ